MPDLFSNPLEFIGLASGLLIAAWLLGPAVKSLMDQATANIDLSAPEGVDPEHWEKVTSIPSEEASRILGLLERSLFFIAIWFGVKEIILAWLAFKVASKWEVWHNLINVPGRLEHVDDLKFLAGRRRWGSYLFMRFLIGTISNILAGITGAFAGKVIFNFFDGL